MKKLAILVAVAMGLYCIGVSKTQAATIDITVSLTAEAVSVTVAPTAWLIGPVALNSTSGSATYTATVGNVPTKLVIRGADSAGGWTIGSPPALNVFEMDVATGTPLILTTIDQELVASVPAYRYESFDLTYKAPSGDTYGSGVAQGFAVTITASVPTP
jgi:hypothetical protein